MKLISHCLTPTHQVSVIRSLIRFSKPRSPLAHLVLYQQYSNVRLALKLFRGEPAISEFDWNFSAIHSSSPVFSTNVCSVLHNVLPLLQPVHGQVIRFRVYVTQLHRHFRLAFASAPQLNCLTLLRNITRRPVLQKVRQHTYNSAMSVCKHRVSGSISLPSRGSFQLSLTVLYAIGHQVVFSLMRWSSHIPTGLHVSCGTLELPLLLHGFAYETITLYRPTFQLCSTTILLLMKQPLPQRNEFLWFRLIRFRSPLLTKSLLLSFPPGTQMFQFPGFPSHILFYSYMDTATLLAVSFLIRRSMDHGLFATTHSLSQLVTSFFGA